MVFVLQFSKFNSAFLILQASHVYDRNFINSLFPDLQILFPTDGNAVDVKAIKNFSSYSGKFTLKKLVTHAAFPCHLHDAGLHRSGLVCASRVVSILTTQC